MANENVTLWRNPAETFFNVKLESLLTLKESTKKLLFILEEIQAKTHCNSVAQDNMDPLCTIPNLAFIDSKKMTAVNDLEDNEALSKLESQAKNLDAIYIEDEQDDCSIFKRLTRKCHCLNQTQYNDFIIHFNEDTKYCTSTLGEVIKNVRILKKFLYMGGGYTKNALMFLYEGLSDSSHNERVEITNACSHADVCNVFDDNTIVTVCVAWPCKYEHLGDFTTQRLAAGLLYKLARVEEGRRYLNFSSKISNNIKKVLRTKSAQLDYETVDSLTTTLTLLNPPLTQHINEAHYRKAGEGMCNRTLIALTKYRLSMTVDEIFTHLELLNYLCEHESGRKELTQYLPNLLSLFKHLLLEYDSSEINIIITNVLNKIVSNNGHEEPEPIRSTIVSHMATEPIKMKHELNQVPSKINNKRSTVGKWESPRAANRSRKFEKDLHSSIIVVPIENDK